MVERIQKDELARRLSVRMQTDQQTAVIWIDALVETVRESFQAGESITIKGFGNFYVRPERSGWVFRFNPGQRLRALFGWSSSYKGP
jgi:DNA-binding protein HU-beta